MCCHDHMVLLLYFHELASPSDEPDSDQSQLPLFLHLYKASIFHLFVHHYTQEFLTIRMHSFIFLCQHQHSPTQEIICFLR